MVYPAYSNGTDGVKERYDQLKSEEQKLDAIRGKSSNANSISSQLDSMPSSRDILYEFLPTSPKESEIVNNLSKMASESGLLVLSVQINKPDTLSLQTASAVDSSDGSGDGSDSASSPAPSQNNPKNFLAEVQITGNYDQIKDFTRKVDGFARYDIVSKMDIQKPSMILSADGKPTTPTDMLTADVKINFNYLDNLKLSDITVNDSIFSNPQADTSIFDKIKTSRTVLSAQPNVGQKGKGNIFLP